MSASEGNVAYDLSFYEKKVSEKRTEQQPVRHVNSSKAMRLKRVKHTSSLKMPKAFNSFNAKELKIIVSACLAFGVLAVFFSVSIYYQSRENELTTAIEQSESELVTLQNDYDGLMVQYDTRMSDAAIEEYAENTLGMQKRENFQLEWITVGDEDDFDNENTKKG
jgi:cell division protein FtsL